MEGAMVGVYKCGRFKGSEDVKVEGGSNGC